MSEAVFEPTTFAFVAFCSTKWAKDTGMLVMSVQGDKKLTKVMCQATVVVVVMNNWLNEWMI